MGIIVKQYLDEPIILVIIEGDLTVPMAKESYRQIAALAKTIEGPIYRITDVRTQKTQLDEILRIVKEAGQGLEGTTSDPRIHNIFVGRERFAMLARDLMSSAQFSGRGNEMAVFDSIDEALVYARKRLKEHDDHDES